MFIFPLLLFLKSSFSSYMITVTLFYQVRANIPEAKKRFEADRNLEHQMIALIPSGLVLVDKLVKSERHDLKSARFFPDEISMEWH